MSCWQFRQEAAKQHIIMQADEAVASLQEAVSAQMVFGGKASMLGMTHRPVKTPYSIVLCHSKVT